VTEHPIIFSAPMIRSILGGTKNQTRRIVKERDVSIPLLSLRSNTKWSGGGFWCEDKEGGVFTAPGRCPFGSVGDRLWVRETMRWSSTIGVRDYSVFGADAEHTVLDAWPWQGKVLSGIHMPRRASRITLEITDVRVQRVQEISEDDAKAEGVAPFFERYPCVGRDQSICTGEFARDFPYRASYACLWDEINGDRALWSSNPFVWAISFTRVEQP
jgi:hypothetical protein